MLHRAILFLLLLVFPTTASALLRAGAFAQDITPTQFPVIVNGGFVEAIATKANDPLHARAIVLESGSEKIAIVVVDSCMLPRELLDDAKARAATLTGISTDRILISATHAHSVPSAMGCLGSDADARYVKILPDLLVKAIAQADKNLAPAKIGATVVQAPDYTAPRRWIFRPDRMRKDPFGELTVRATMHPGYQSPDAIGPSGPEDPGLSIVSIQTASGKPLALLANFSMHYVGAPALSADYYGQFCAKVAKLMNADESFVGIMSQGTSGDMWLADYTGAKPEKRVEYQPYAEALASLAADACKSIRYTDDAPIVMRESHLKLRRRVPDEKRLDWAREKAAALNGAKPKAQSDVYASEAIMLHDEPERELKLQAIRIGDIAIAGIPNEVYALTGLKIKSASPLPLTFNIGLANGSEGYIPPAEQHPLGGYTTWPARTAALEVNAEPKIAEAVIQLLEQVTNQKRREFNYPQGPYAKALLAAKPAAYYRMAEMSAAPVDSSGNNHPAAYETGVVFYLPGPETLSLTADPAIPTRSAHFVGGRLKTTLPATANSYTVECLVWNGLAPTARPVTAYFFSRGPDGDKAAPGDHLGIGGTHENGAHAGKLLFFNGEKSNALLAGKTPLALRTWYHVAMVRDARSIALYLNGQLEAQGEADNTSPDLTAFFGGRCDHFSGLEGKLAEAAIFPRALAADEIAAHAKAAALPTPPVQAAVPIAPQAAPQTASDSQAALRAAHPPRSPGQTLKSLHIPPGMTVEVVAAEPLISSPVAIDWGADGKLWVVEMADYPYGLDGKGKPGGRVKFLESTKGDGHYDKATLFLDHLKMPTGIIAWRKGVLITAAPDLIYAEDTDGDGKADKQDVLFTGFLNRNPQLRVNGLRWGLDNWLYLANGWSAGVIESKKTGQKLDIKNRDLRIRPDTGEMELVSGVSQFGRERDDIGRWFGVDNSHPLFHYVLDDHYLRRNPYVTYPDSKIQLLPLPLPPVFPRSPFTKRYIGLDHHGHYTSACGLNIYRDNLLFAEPQTPTPAPLHAFICEPVHNLIQHQLLTESGTTFTAQRVDGEPNTDFIAAEDPWFRPVMTRTGPDGAVWVVDMYRYMIEHPDWLNAEGKAALAPFYRDGEARGRIYRLFPKDKSPRPIPRLDTLSTPQLIATLESPSGHTRDLAQQLLLQQNDAVAAGLLHKFFTTTQSPLAKLHALCALDGLSNRIPSELLTSALSDPHPALRAAALRLAEPRIKADPDLLISLCKLTTDASPFVRQQLAYTLGESNQPPAIAAFKQLAATAADDPGLLGALLSSATGPRFSAGVEQLAASRGADSPLLAPLLDIALATHDHASLATLLTALDIEKSAPAASAAYALILDKLAAHHLSTESLSKSNPALRASFARLVPLYERARLIVAGASESPAARTAACALLGRSPAARGDELKLLATLFTPQTPTDLQQAALRAAARTADPALPEILLAHWSSSSPILRTAIADVLLAREAWAMALLESPAARELDFARRQRLLNHASAKVKIAARSILAQNKVDADRQKVIDSYAPALTLPGDAKRGLALYTEHCATCHKIGALPIGQDLGPNLLTVREWPRENLLAAVLDPNRTAEPRYLSYTASLADGTSLTGLLTAESAGNVTLKTLDAIDHTIPRAALRSLITTNLSLMPPGFEAALTPQDLADLFTFIASPTPPR